MNKTCYFCENYEQGMTTKDNEALKKENEELKKQLHAKELLERPFL